MSSFLRFSHQNPLCSFILFDMCYMLHQILSSWFPQTYNTEICFPFFRTGVPSCDTRQHPGSLLWDQEVTLLVVKRGPNYGVAWGRGQLIYFPEGAVPPCEAGLLLNHCSLQQCSCTVEYSPVAGQLQLISPHYIKSSLSLTSVM
jgi:hypothetical protein